MFVIHSSFFSSSRFTLALPHPVDSDHSQAKWDKEKCQLQVTLRLDREYDDFNS